jgi:alkylhydroperoxidase/carboxymuconolactone decarboxylase family protein YurZ
MKKLMFFLLILITLFYTQFVLAESINNMDTMRANQTLDIKQQGIITISALTAKGDLTQLHRALNDGLNAGLTINQTKEILVQLYAYCGFPRSIRGLQTFMSVLEERRIKGINDEEGKTASPITDERSKYERGKEVLGKLTGSNQDAPATGYAAFSPTTDTFLKEHLFADIFERDILTYAQRELVTVSVISAIGGAEPMLKSHLTICLNVGITPEQLQQFITIIQSSIGKKEAENAELVLNDVLKNTTTQKSNEESDND